MRKGAGKKLIKLMIPAAVVLLSAVLAVVFEGKVSAAPGRTLTMKAARALALEESMEYFQVEQSISTKEAALKSAQKAIKLKQISMSTFRWSPLLSLKFPTNPTEAEACEFQFKPISIQAEIDEATHKLTDTKLGIYEEVNNLYVDIVVLQRTIAFNERRLAAYEEGLEKNKLRLLTGEGTQADVDKIEKKLEQCKTKVSTDKNNLASSLRKLSNKVGTDVSTGYSFETPFQEAQVPRAALPWLIQYTLDRDQTYYAACLDETTARINLQINYSLMKNKYGGDINMIAPYVNMALSGQTIKGGTAKAFKKDYDAFINKIDSYWWGKKRICLFIKIPRIWMKGSLDGTRYIDDDPYVLYTATLEYAEAASAKLAAEADLEEQVIDNFDTYASIRTSYIKGLESLDKAEADLEADKLRNMLGELSFEEYDSELSDYEQQQNDIFELMKTYSQTLYSYDRLTCGGISAYLSGDDAGFNTGGVGTSHVEKETTEGASYYIKQIIQSQAFELSIYIPEDFEVEITHFELWCDKERIGGRTEIDKKLRHLAITKDGVNAVKIRLYNGEEFVDDVVIDPSETSGPLPIVKDRKIVKVNPEDIGLVEISTSDGTGLLDIRLDITEDTAVASYRVRTAEGKYLSGSSPVQNGKSFRHLTLVETGLEETVIELLDKEGNLLYNARFDMQNHRIRKEITE